MSKREGIMLAHPLDVARLERERVVYYQPKIDGLRCRAVCKVGEVTLYSSQGNVISSLPWIDAEISEELKNETLVLDGELHSDRLNFQELVSAVKRISPTGRGGYVRFKVFDLIESGTFTERLTKLQVLFATHKLSTLEIVETNMGTPSQLASHLESYMLRGFEGIIIRKCDGIYETKRSWGLMKYKPTRFDRYTITGYEEEISINGEPKEALGAFVCRSESGETFSVGSGPLLTRMGRKELWERRASLIGKVIRVKYQELTADRKVPRFPVVVTLEGGQ